MSSTTPEPEHGHPIVTGSQSGNGPELLVKPMSDFMKKAQAGAQSGGVVCKSCGGSGYSQGGEVGRTNDPKWFDRDRANTNRIMQATDAYSSGGRGRGGEEDEAGRSESFMRYLVRRREARRH